MLKKIENLSDCDISGLKSNWYGRKILSCLNLPCDIYKAEYGYVLVTEGYMCFDSEFLREPVKKGLNQNRVHEIETFIMMCAPSRIDGYSELMPGYVRLRRTMFEMKQGSAVWDETEIVKDKNTYIYKNTTEASIVYDEDGIALIAGVHTQKEFRGKGQAREILNYIFNENKDKKLYLYALDIRRSYYLELGYEIVSADFVLERDIRTDKDEL
ncbi:MAG: hypothetical protein LBL93_02745 [Ruminococcus sp.]|jgi:GNAT superfamily N-acetyltransferase|nr:hypothetical protein [Ruminococcus sp.]